jgi:hypothetical protein
LAGVVVPPVDDEGFAADSFFAPEPEPELESDLVDDESDLLSDDDDDDVAGASDAADEARLSVR